MNEHNSLEEIKKEYHGTLKSYLIGFFLAIALTFLSFFLVIARAFSNQMIIYSVVFLALIQAVVQLRFFLHLGHEPKPRWETLVFCLMVLILLIISTGSLWIMHDLNQRMMPQMP